MKYACFKLTLTPELRPRVVSVALVESSCARKLTEESSASASVLFLLTSFISFFKGQALSIFFEIRFGPLLVKCPLVPFWNMPSFINKNFWVVRNTGFILSRNTWKLTAIFLNPKIVGLLHVAWVGGGGSKCPYFLDHPKTLKKQKLLFYFLKVHN